MQKSWFGIKKNVIVLGIVSLLNDAAGESVIPLLPYFLTVVLGAPIWAVGLVEGVADSASSILKVVSGWLSDRSGRRKAFVTLGYTLPIAGRGALFFANNWLHVLVLRFVDRSGKGIREAPRDAIVSETIAKLRGRAFGFHRAMDRFGAVIGPLLAIALLPLFGIRGVFAFTVVPGLLSLILLILFVKTKNHPPKKRLTLALALRKFDKKFIKFVAITGLFSIANFSYAFLILRAQNLGADLVSVTFLYLTYALVYSLSATPIGMLSDKIGRKWIIIFGFVLFAAICGSFIFVNSYELLIGLFILYGIFSATVPVWSAYGSDLVGPERRASALGALYTVIGLTTLPASVLAGLLWQTFGFAATFSFAAALAAVSAVAFAVFVKNKSFV